MPIWKKPSDMFEFEKPKTSRGGWCYDCGHYRLTIREARAVARRLNKLEQENAQLTNRVIAVEFVGKKPYWKQACGHEQRFIVSGTGGTNWCALCEIEGLEQIAAMWAQTLREAKEATDG